MNRLLSWPHEEFVSATRTDIIGWWESGRLRFNVYVGAVGIATWLLVFIAGSAAVRPGVDFEEPIAMIFGPFIYGFLANVFYTLGWIFDLAFYQGKPRVCLYKSGVIFSVVLTALPGIWAVIGWLYTIVSGHKLAD
jgi:hypothetical protein